MPNVPWHKRQRNKQHNTTTPLPGFTFLCAGVVYFGANYAAPEIDGAFTLSKDSYDASFRAALPRGSYVSHVFWSPRSNCLLLNDNGCQFVYDNVSSSASPSPPIAPTPAPFAIPAVI
jgi:hypothetical protein